MIRFAYNMGNSGGDEIAMHNLFGVHVYNISSSLHTVFRKETQIVSASAKPVVKQATILTKKFKKGQSYEVSFS